MSDPWKATLVLRLEGVTLDVAVHSNQDATPGTLRELAATLTIIADAVDLREQVRRETLQQ